MDRRPSSVGVRDLVGRPAARAGAVLVALWLGTAFVLHDANEFGAMIAILACASVVLWGSGRGARFLAGQLILWAALLAATAVVLWGSPHLLAMMLLFAAAAAWFVIAEPLLRARRAS